MYYVLFLFISISVFGQTTTNLVKKVSISNFSNYKTNPDSKMQENIYKSLSNRFKENGYTVDQLTESSLEKKLATAKANGSSFLIDGYYKKTSGENLNIFVQIYNTENGKLIDAFNQSPESLPELGQITLDKSEMTITDDKAIEDMSKKVFTRIRANPKRLENRENINEYVAQAPIGNEMNIPIPQEDVQKASEDVFKLLSEDNSISIVSKRVGQSESVDRTSAIVSVISRSRIVDSGARNLADILKSVPGLEVFYDQFGFYKVALRGIRSKSGMLLMIDGHRMNNFYDGSTFIDIRADAIEKVEIIRGPGSSVHGTNALVGVINVVTRDLGSGKNSQGVFSTRAGSFNTFEPTAFYSRKIGESDWRFTTYAGSYQSDRQQNRIPYDDSCARTTPTAGQPFGGLSNACSNPGYTVLPLYASPWVKTNDQKRQNNLFLKLQNGRDGFYITGKVLNETRGPNMGEIATVTPSSELNFNFMNGAMGINKLNITEKLLISGKVYGDSYARRDDIQV
ncbi:MAG TPA: Plug domain-containing protein, partial [Leptospiraceae bacterium]|nr:Plug domain-containing protein [Leptospiraceae bacterium]